MPRITIASEQKTQPWREHWPPKASANTTIMAGYKAGELFTIDGGGGAGAYGYNDKGEGVAMPKETPKEK